MPNDENRSPTFSARVARAVEQLALVLYEEGLTLHEVRTTGPLRPPSEVQTIAGPVTLRSEGYPAGGRYPAVSREVVIPKAPPPPPVKK